MRRQRSRSSSNPIFSALRRVWRAERKVGLSIVLWETAFAEATTSGALPSQAASFERVAKRWWIVSVSVTSRSKGSASVSGKCRTRASSPLHSVSCSWRRRASSGRGVTISIGAPRSCHSVDSTNGAASGSTWVLVRTLDRSRDFFRRRYWGAASSRPPRALRLIRLVRQRCRPCGPELSVTQS